MHSPAANRRTFNDNLRSAGAEIFRRMSSLLFEDLTGIKLDGADPPNNKFAATSLSHSLLLLVGLDVIQFRRNQQVAYRVVERARDAVKNINGVIEGISSTATPTDAQWDAFDTYHKGIDEVEDLLLKLADGTEDEAKRFLPEDGSTIAKWIEELKDWEKNRNTVCEIADGLATKDSVVKVFDPPQEDSAWKSEISKSTAEDDIAFLKDLLERITLRSTDVGAMRTSQKRKALVKSIEKVKAALLQLPTKLQPSDYKPSIGTVAVKYSFAILGVMTIVLDKTAANRDDTVYFQEKLVWEEAWLMVDHLVAGTDTYDAAAYDSTPAKSHATIAEHFQHFLDILTRSVGPEIPIEFWELMKLPGTIHRPYRARALALVQVCRDLVKIFRDQDKVKKSQFLNSLESALISTVEALKATSYNGDLRAVYDLNSYEGDAVITKYKEAQETLKTCVTDFEASDKWGDMEQAINDAKGTDCDTVELMNKRFEKTRSNIKIVTVTVDIKGGAGPQTKIVKVEETARLSALRYSVACLEAAQKDAVNKGTFQKKGDPASVFSLDKSMLDVFGENVSSGEVTLVIS
ncbi:hypothetical protein DL96DRAFT_1819700 [Flagelloscypha sp. PMI_526]|nr:hypothetical protein DL96DRAFT_1819700 [Flagelloscypha sp. PMI_526]